MIWSAGSGSVAARVARRRATRPFANGTSLVAASLVRRPAGRRSPRSARAAPRGGDEQRSLPPRARLPEARHRGSDKRGYVNRGPVPARSPVRGWGYFLAAAFFLRSAQ